MAIAATAFVGYNALSLFAEDGRPIQPLVERMNHVPGVKAVGIRMITPSGKLPTSRIDTAPTTANTIASLTLLPSETLPLETSMPSKREEVSLPPQLSLPAPSFPNATFPTTSIAPSEIKSPSGFINLTAPPRISDVNGGSPKGPVVMRITEGNDGKEDLPNQKTLDVSSPESNQVVTGPDLVDIRVVQPRSMGQPAKMPPFVFAKSGKKPDASSAQSTLPSEPSKVRIAITDSGDNKEHFQPIPNSRNVTQPRNRFPQLVKSKPTQIAHTVVLAQSTNLELQSTAEQPDEFFPPVQIDSSLVPHSVSSGSVIPKAETDKKFESVLAYIVPDTIASHTIETRDDPKLLAKHSSTSSTMDSIDTLRRSFDSSVPIQSQLETVEIECLAATTMNLAGNLVAIAVQDENVCKALHNERTISLIGNQPGTTLVQIWTKEAGKMPQVVRVNVAPPWGRTQTTRSDVNDIKQVIAKGFPRSNVKILNKEDGTIEVRGTTDSEESARRILELVRKLYLIPVKDRLTVSN